MFQLIIDNLSSLIVLALLSVLVIVLIRGQVRARKAGAGCASGCHGCPSANACSSVSKPAQPR